MFKDAAPNLRLFLDDESKKLRVQVNALASAPQLHPMWQEVESYSTPEEWKASKYAAKVKSEEWLDELAWFWLDISNTAPLEPQASV